MENLELLVKLASFGTAGVCVLAIFLIGTSLVRLGNDTPEWKAKLMGKFMNTCIIIAIICTISGSANAYFNQNKIARAREDFTEVLNKYEEEVEQLEGKKKQLNEEIQSLQRSLERSSSTDPEVKEQVKSLKSRVDQLQMTPRDEVIKNLKPSNRIRKIK